MEAETPLYSIQEVAEAVNAWCAEHGLSPANGQAGEAVTERNIRYYRTLGLIDAPLAGAGPGFGEKHLLQLRGIRLLQAQGLPLRRIRELLYGRSLADLRELTERGAREAGGAAPGAVGEDEHWRVTPLDADFMLISRRGGPALSPAQKARILQILRTHD